ncbi:hypothetical protein SAMN05444920_107206 [Nonomuraea solani]|uniref:Uncharacterized protein n=1 Tax=Nonomuraea solani TaxID=1144553 RepID=A0A1H6E2E3_9ACTN|nr:hypothetical protein [Nonomuraea solani]SEG91166.1 hypothetical protein SAMN05444920_107206 [Nonomuraea solani]
MKIRVLIAAGVLALAAGAPPLVLDKLGEGTPVVNVESYVQHINVLTS